MTPSLSGAVGVNFHQGAGQNLYSAWIDLGAGTGPIVRPQYYGWLALQMALGNGSRLVGKQVYGNGLVKVFPLQVGPPL